MVARRVPAGYGRCDVNGTPAGGVKSVVREREALLLRYTETMFYYFSTGEVKCVMHRSGFVSHDDCCGGGSYTCKFAAK